MRELERWRDGLVTNRGMKASSANRTAKALKAALSLCAKRDKRITNRDAWRDGLEALPDSHTPRNVILSDDDVRSIVAAAYQESRAFGLLAEVAAQTGARVSQIGRLEVRDLQDDRTDVRVIMPGSKKGRGRKHITRKPVPITPALAAKLRQAAGKRPANAPLLLRSDGEPWRPAQADYRQPFINAVTRVGLDPDVVTLYSLRHSNIVRQILANTPLRVIAVNHDTSVAMLEKTYSAFIGDVSDAVTRRTLLDTAQPASGNVVALPAGRS
jgi:integrase